MANKKGTTVMKVIYALKGGERLGRPRDVEYYGSPFFVRDTLSGVRLSVGKKERMVSNGKAGVVWDAISKIGVTPDLKNVVYVAKSGKGERVVCGNVESSAWDSVTDYTFSSKGDLAFIGTKKKEQYVIHGKSVSDAWDFIANLHFDDDGGLVYSANRGGKRDKTVQGNWPVDGTGQWYLVKKNTERKINTWNQESTKQQWNYVEFNWPEINASSSSGSSNYFGKPIQIDKHRITVIKKGKTTTLSFDGQSSQIFDEVFCVYWEPSRIRATVRKDDKLGVLDFPR